MSFLLENNSENISARVTKKGRQKIAQGKFNISYFQIGDSEFDYAYPEFNGSTNDAQKVLMPMDKDNQVKYPYKVSTSTLTGTTYGTPVQSSYTYPAKNTMLPAGFVSGLTMYSDYDVIDIAELDGSTSIDLPSGVLLSGLTTDDYITLVLSSLTDVLIDGQALGVITGASMSFVYRITGITSNTLTLDRTLPDFSSLSPFNVTVIKNGYYPYRLDNCNQHDSWTLNTVWSQMPAGLVPTVDEDLSGYTSNIFVSTKEYLGYNSPSGQTYNTGTTITNSSGDIITVPPEEQHSLAILRYPRDIDIYNVHDLGFKYEDFIDSTTDGSDYFIVNIPFIYYDRYTGSTIGAQFYMDTTDYYVNSAATDTRPNQMAYRRLIDGLGNAVGKVFYNQKIIVFDDQEIIAALDYKSNRRYTLPIPRVSTVPADSKCDVLGNINDPLLPSGKTVFLSYLLSYTGDTGLNGLHCNHYGKVIGGAVASDVSLTFGSNDFQFMTTGTTTDGYVANKFYILAQQVDTGLQPDPDGWKIIDYTDELTLVSGFINREDLRGTRFIVSMYDYDTLGTIYNLEDYLGSLPDEPSGSSIPEFGDEQPFPGQIDVIRGYDIEVMRFLINLPSGYFETTQNPSYVTGVDKRITEVALLDSNKDVLVIAKTSSPIVRSGTQVVAVKIDF